jgi:hypothetical protein
MSWATTKTAICTAIQSNLGLASGKLVWGFEGKSPLPSYPFCTITRKSMQAMGSTVIQTTTNAPTPVTPGQEVISTSMMPCKMVWSLDYFDVQGGSAFEVLSLLNTRMHSSATIRVLSNVNAGLWGIGQVRSVPAIRFADYEDRAQIELTFGIQLTTTEYATYIEHITGTVSADSGITTRTWSIDLPNPS